MTNWLPTYLNRDFGMETAASAQIGAVGMLAAAVGAVAWGQVADRWGMREAKGRLWVPALGAASCVFLSWVAFGFLTPGPVQLGLTLAVFFCCASVMGPVNAVAMDVVETGLHASVNSLVGLAQNLLGLAAGPMVIGLLSDRLGLATALLVLPVAATISCGCFLLATRSYAYERARRGGGDRDR